MPRIGFVRSPECRWWSADDDVEEPIFPQMTVVESVRMRMSRTGTAPRKPSQKPTDHSPCEHWGSLEEVPASGILSRITSISSDGDLGSPMRAGFPRNSVRNSRADTVESDSAVVEWMTRRVSFASRGRVSISSSSDERMTESYPDDGAGSRRVPRPTAAVPWVGLGQGEHAHIRRGASRTASIYHAARMITGLQSQFRSSLQGLFGTKSCNEAYSPERACGMSNEDTSEPKGTPDVHESGFKKRPSFRARSPTRNVQSTCLGIQIDDTTYVPVDVAFSLLKAACIARTEGRHRPVDDPTPRLTLCGR